MVVSTSRHNDSVNLDASGIGTILVVGLFIYDHIDLVTVRNSAVDMYETTNLLEVLRPLQSDFYLTRIIITITIIHIT